VKTFEREQRSPGVYSRSWNGTDDQGRRVARGVYFVRLDVPGHGFTQKVVMAR